MSRLAPTASSTSASATAARAAIRRATRRTRKTCSATCSALDVDHGTPYAIPAARPEIRSRPTRSAPPTIRARTTAPRSTRGVFAIRGAGASIPRPAICGSATWVRTATRRSIGCSEAATTVGTVARARTPTRTARPQRAVRRRPVSSSPSSTTTTRNGNSITGGFVYRGTALPALVGHYVFADYGSGRIWRLDSNGSGGYTAVQLARHESRDRVVRAG